MGIAGVNDCPRLKWIFMSLRRIPRLAQSNVCDAIIVAEGYVELAVSIEGTAVETDVLLKSLKEEGSFIDGGFCFARHEDYYHILTALEAKVG